LRVWGSRSFSLCRIGIWGTLKPKKVITSMQIQQFICSMLCSFAL
jgi:hypothetical protein